MIRPSKDSTIIVANSPIVLNRKLGEEIDKFESVFRVNDYVIEGFEEKVGTKTTHWITGAGNQTKVKARDLDGIEPILFLPQDRIGRFTMKEILKQVRENLFLDPIEFHIIHSQFIEGVKKTSKLEQPSTGAMAILFCLYYLRLPSVVIYGFDHFKNKRHYYDNGDFHISRRHSWEQEEAWFSVMKKKEKIIDLVEYIKK